MKKKLSLCLIALVLAWAILTFLIWPQANLLFSIFFPDGHFSFDAVEKLIKSQRATRSLINSVLLALFLSVSNNLVGIFIVLVTRYFRIYGAQLLWLGFATTFIYGGVVLAAGYKFIYGAKGIATQLLSSFIPGLDPHWFQGFWAVAFTMTLATTTNHLLFVSAALRKIDNQTIEAARNMGASHLLILRRIVLPTLAPTLFAVTILTFLTGLGALSAPQILGGREFQTITPLVLAFSMSQSSRQLAALLALSLGLITIGLLVVFNHLEKSGMYFSVSKVSMRLQKQKIDNPIANNLIHLLAYFLWLLYILPIALIVIFSFMSPAAIADGKLNFSALSLENYIRVFTHDNALRPFVVSVGYGVLAALIATVLMLFVAHIVSKYHTALAKILEYALHIPWLLPATMLALGLIMSYDHPTAQLGGMVLTGTPIILLIAYVIVKIPFTLRLLKAAFSSLNSSCEEAATLLGANPLYIFRRITLPAIFPATAAVTALNITSLLDDYDMAVFLAHPRYQPLGLIIQANTTGAVGPEAHANTLVYSVLLMIISTVTMYVVYGRAHSERYTR
ncbi:iron ABC transporter permease [Corynebacterium sp. sy039]|uniref:ABC transporter permease n=1 Tax=Corynebacterium sp. sy039 TaxID=2599641 RepID=UPI0011B5CD5E|nr:iron ABC transporter permease [Corynebacterium sp. sy039]QDZ41918.1 iron ABC transporter permease [Corynebacterium sp. sy039]